MASPVCPLSCLLQTRAYGDETPLEKLLHLISIPHRPAEELAEL